MNEKNSASRPPTELNAPLSADNLETLEHLHRAIELADGFALFFACCDQPTQRDDLIAHLNALLLQQGRLARRLDVVPPAKGLLASLKNACRPASYRSAGPSSRASRPAHRLSPIESQGGAQARRRSRRGMATPACVHVCGLEDVLLPDNPHPPVLSQINLARDRFRDLPCPLVFWLPDAALTRLAQGAPDFWAWGSGIFDFLPRWVPLARLIQAQPEPSEVIQAERRIRVLENLLADYRTLGDGPTEQRARAGLLVDLADLYQVTYRPQTARQRLEEALPLVRRLKDTALEIRTRDLLRGLNASPETKDLGS
jgi:hypothetical protein